LTEVKNNWKRDAVFTPGMDTLRREKLVSGWHKAVGRSRDWADT
jgi:glycerol kinase